MIRLLFARMIHWFFAVGVALALILGFTAYLLIFLPADWAIAVSLILTLLTVWRGVGWEGITNDD